MVSMLPGDSGHTLTAYDVFAADAPPDRRSTHEHRHRHPPQLPRRRARGPRASTASVFGGELVAVTYADAGTVQDPAEADQVMWGQVTSPTRVPSDGLRRPLGDCPGTRATNAFFVSVRGTTAEEITGYWEGL